MGPSVPEPANFREGRTTALCIRIQRRGLTIHIIQQSSRREQHGVVCHTVRRIVLTTATTQRILHVSLLFSRYRHPNGRRPKGTRKSLGSDHMWIISACAPSHRVPEDAREARYVATLEAAYAGRYPSLLTRMHGRFVIVRWVRAKE